MKRIIIKIAKKTANLSLSAKIVSVVMIVVFLTVSASLLGVDMILSSCNKLLYQSLAGSLNYSAEDISAKLTNVESMTSAIISNKSIRKNLISVSDEASGIKLSNAASTLNYLIFDYYQNYKNNNISYINLYNPKFSTSSYQAKSRTTPAAVHEAVIKASNATSGYPCWITDYCNTYGLFLGRDSRRADKLKFDTLGTLVVNVDMDKLIKTSTRSVLHTSDAVQYILYDKNRPIYHSKSLNASYVDTINRTLTSDYDVLKVGDSQYFCVRGTISNFSWNYICLIHYGYVSDTLNMARFLSLSVILLSALFSLLFSRLIIRSITRDFRVLVDKMDAFGKDESRLPDSSNDYSSRRDEIAILHNQFDQMAVKLQNLIRENYVNEILAKDAKLKALENQINPHFLYNTLESVNWRAKAIGEKDISSMVESLGALLRVTLSQKDMSFTVRHELEIVRNYMTIQQIRFDDRLSYSEEMPEEILEARLPQLTIQPLVENAISYGMDEITEPCHIRIEGELSSQTIRIRVINNGSQFEDRLLEKLADGQISPHGFGIGLLNIHQRIQLIYGDTYGLAFYNLDEEHAVAQITLPGGAHDQATDC